MADRRSWGAAVRPASSWEQPPPTITVEATYPGASAQVLVGDYCRPDRATGQRRREHESRCGRNARNDGAYRLAVTFNDRAEFPNLAQVLVQNRAALALPMLPARRHGPGRHGQEGNHPRR